jgi:DNA-binding MarR family transcriptional regulator
MKASSASTEPSVEALAAELHGLWRRLLRGSTKGLYALLSELDLSMTQMKTLHSLAEREDEVSVKELAEELSMSLPNASRTVDNLLQRGLLERREDTNDRRMKRVAVTDAGRDVVTRIDTARLQGLESWAAGLSPEQRDTLLEALLTLPEECRR